MGAKAWLKNGTTAVEQIRSSLDLCTTYLLYVLYASYARWTQSASNATTQPLTGVSLFLLRNVKIPNHEVYREKNMWRTQRLCLGPFSQAVKMLFVVFVDE